MIFRFSLIVLCCGALLSGSAADAGLKLPYKKEGLSKEQAAAYLLERFAFGPRPGEVEKVAKMGPEKWLAQQLAGNLPDAELDEAPEKVSRVVDDAFARDSTTIYMFKMGGFAIRMEQRRGDRPDEKMPLKEINEKMKVYREKHGLRPYGVLSNQELKESESDAGGV